MAGWGRRSPFSVCDLPEGLSPGGAWQFVEKRFGAVILSPSLVILSVAKDLGISLRVNSAKNLLVRQINHLRDSSSPATPQNDILVELFNKLLGARPFSSPSVFAAALSERSSGCDRR